MTSPSFNPYSCVDQIISAIYENQLRGEVGLRDRALDANELLQRYWYNCNFADDKFWAMFTTFSDTTDSIVEAIECYRNGQLNASVVMLRNAIDASTYASLVLKPVKDASGKVNTISPIGSGIMEYKKYEKWPNREKKIISMGLLLKDDLDYLKDVRDKTNFSAHIFEIKRDEIHKYLKSMARLVKPQPNMPKQFVTESEVKKYLYKVIPILMKLHENYLKYYGVL